MTSLTREDLAGRNVGQSALPLVGRLLDYLERRRVYNTLVAMDDRMLDDLGLTRATLKLRIFEESAAAKRPSLVARMWKSYKQARQRRETIRELQRLSPSMLADIGIEPGLVPEYAQRRQGNGEWVFEPQTVAPSLGRMIFDLAEATAAPFVLPSADRLNPGRTARAAGKHLEDLGYMAKDQAAQENRQRDAANRDKPKAAA